MFFASITGSILLAAGASPLSANCQTKVSAQSSGEVQVVIPFAVPVGVPVAPLAPYFYSYQQLQGRAADYVLPSSQPPAAAAPAAPADAPPMVSAPNPSSLVVAHCASCHGGQTPKAGLSLQLPSALSPADRLRVIQAVITNRMPKGSQLSSEERNAIIGELSHQSALPAAAPASPPDKKPD
jgi:mono/diheme cytochrome c family protein